MSVRNCGECFFNDVNIVELDSAGVCPVCGADYGPDCSTVQRWADDGGPIPEDDDTCSDLSSDEDEYGFGV